MTVHDAGDVGLQRDRLVLQVVRTELLHRLQRLRVVAAAAAAALIVDTDPLVAAARREQVWIRR